MFDYYYDLTVNAGTNLSWTDFIEALVNTEDQFYVKTTVIALDLVREIDS